MAKFSLKRTNRMSIKKEVLSEMTFESLLTPQDLPRIKYGIYNTLQEMSYIAFMENLMLY